MPADPTDTRSWTDADRETVRPVLALYLGSDYLHLDDATAAVLDALAAAGRLADPWVLPSEQPGRWELPAPPARPVWTTQGHRAEPCPDHLRCWVLEPGTALSHYRWPDLLTLGGPLSATPPEDREPPNHFGEMEHGRGSATPPETAGGGQA